MAMAFTVLIPARYASTRLPGKPLADIAGKPMVVRVARARAAARAPSASSSRPTTSAIRAAVRGARHRRLHDARRPSDRHRPPGRGGARARPRRRRDRRQRPGRRAAARAGADPRGRGRCWPRIRTRRSRPRAIRSTIPPRRSIRTSSRSCSTPRGYALYFSRATIPWARDAFAQSAATRIPQRLPLYRHYGLYAYRVGFLRALSDAGAGADRAFRGAGAAARAVARPPDRRRGHRRNAGARRRHARGPRARARALRARRALTAGAHGD